MIGLKRGSAKLCEYCSSWETEAKKLINVLHNIFQDNAIDIQHIGSTSIIGIKAKPILDIAVGVVSLKISDNFLCALEDNGIYRSNGQPFENIVLFSKDNPKTGYRESNIQVMLYDSDEWNCHILFRDYMNACADKALEYEKIKSEAAEKFPENILAYSEYKNGFIQKCLAEAKARKHIS